MSKHPETIAASPQVREYYFREGCYISELHNQPGDQACSVARARVTAGTTTRRHRLSGITERYLILEGSGLVELGSSPPRPVRAGDSVLIPAGVSQRITNNGQGDLLFLAVCTPRFQEACYQELEESET
ncbi:cupin domain-containing protein [Desulfogranum mediterraneum]|uniref:cupin domain-containing protein n=1 Tax=Desulfogranum mediterraneum TaxID=160661 RepID=UPI000412E5F0|nr:cupin domain-containing protein [Desulfogranum mediterraneum]